MITTDEHNSRCKDGLEKIKWSRDMRSALRPTLLLLQKAVTKYCPLVKHTLFTSTYVSTNVLRFDLSGCSPCRDATGRDCVNLTGRDSSTMTTKMIILYLVEICLLHNLFEVEVVRSSKGTRLGRWRKRKPDEHLYKSRQPNAHLVNIIPVWDRQRIGELPILVHKVKLVPRQKQSQD